MELEYLGGTYGGNRKPTPFMCLVMKMLQIQPEKEIVIEFIKNEDYKYFHFFIFLYSLYRLLFHNFLFLQILVLGKKVNMVICCIHS